MSRKYISKVINLPSGQTQIKRDYIYVQKVEDGVRVWFSDKDGTRLEPVVSDLRIYNTAGTRIY